MFHFVATRYSIFKSPFLCCGPPLFSESEREKSVWVFSNINYLKCQIMPPSVDDILTFRSLSQAAGSIYVGLL